MLVTRQVRDVPRSDAYAFLPRTLHLHKVCLEHRTDVSGGQTHLYWGSKSTFQSFLTQNAAAGLENGPSLPQSHGSTHLPRVVFWHVDHLIKFKKKKKKKKKDVKCENLNSTCI